MLLAVVAVVARGDGVVVVVVVVAVAAAVVVVALLLLLLLLLLLVLFSQCRTYLSLFMTVQGLFMPKRRPTRVRFVQGSLDSKLMHCKSTL